MQEVLGFIMILMVAVSVAWLMTELVLALALRLLPRPELDCGREGINLGLNEAEKAEVMLRGFLMELKEKKYTGEATVTVCSQDTYEIAEKILRKYPNIGLLYK